MYLQDHETAHCKYSLKCNRQNFKMSFIHLSIHPSSITPVFLVRAMWIQNLVLAPLVREEYTLNGVKVQAQDRTEGPKLGHRQNVKMKEK